MGDSRRWTLAHKWVDHEVGRIRLDDGASAWSADDMRLYAKRPINPKTPRKMKRATSEGDAAHHKRHTMSQPSFALAMAEKYGAPV